MPERSARTFPLPRPLTPAMRNLLLGLSIGLASLLVGGTAVALVGIAVVAPLVAGLLTLRRRPARRRRLPRAAVR
jgi:hypothetical protein